VQAEVDAGHAVANHMFTHRTLFGISWEVFTSEVLRTQLVLGDSGSPCLRPAGGAIDARARAYARKLGLQVVLWDIDPRDWRRAWLLSARLT
jgi:peptidoglycan/xylan/chitin deacetylase (PgdA/CDA1 family)